MRTVGCGPLSTKTQDALKRINKFNLVVSYYIQNMKKNKRCVTAQEQYNNIL